MRNRLNVIFVLVSGTLLIAVLLGFVFKALTSAFIALTCAFGVVVVAVMAYVFLYQGRE
jgi:hypothetical protein